MRPTAYGQHQRSRGISIGGSSDRRKRKKKRGRHASGRATPQQRHGVAPRPHTANIGDVRDRSDIARHAMRDEGAGLGTTGLGAAHGFLSEDRGASYGYMGEGPEAGPLREARQRRCFSPRARVGATESHPGGRVRCG